MLAKEAKGKGRQWITALDLASAARMAGSSSTTVLGRLSQFEEKHGSRVRGYGYSEAPRVLRTLLEKREANAARQRLYKSRHRRSLDEIGIRVTQGIDGAPYEISLAEPA